MNKISQQTVPEMEHISLNVDWNDIRIFNAAARSSSFRKASASTGMSVNSIRRRIEALEQQLGNPLFLRDATGINLTSEGVELLKASARMVEASYDISRVVRSRSKEHLGTVKIGVTEGLGTFWLIPRLVEFQSHYPAISLDLKCTMTPADTRTLEADVAVQLDRPEDNESIIMRIGYLHLQLFASHEYIRQYGEPDSLADLVNFKFVEQVSPQVSSELMTKMIPNIPKDFVSVRTNTSSAHAYAISKGAGIGVLPTYARAVTKRVVPVLRDIHLTREIYMTYPREVKNQPRVAAAIDWLKQSFDPDMYPWFGERFVAPDQFEQRFQSGNVIHLFEGFQDE